MRGKEAEQRRGASWAHTAWSLCLAGPQATALYCNHPNILLVKLDHYHLTCVLFSKRYTNV
jgi:hypothetical protein